MIRHQAVRVAYPPGSLDSDTKYFEEPNPINIIEEDIFPCVSATGDMIYSAFVFNPQWTSHAGSIARGILKVKIRPRSFYCALLLMLIVRSKERIKKSLEIDYPRSKITGHSANFILV